MKRNFLLIGVFLMVLLLIVNSVKRISSLRDTSSSIRDQEQQLEQLKKENEALKHELEYKKSDKFAEGEIRNKLGLAKPGEAIVILPNKGSAQSIVNSDKSDSTPNYKKWWALFFGG